MAAIDRGRARARRRADRPGRPGRGRRGARPARWRLRPAGGGAWPARATTATTAVWPPTCCAAGVCAAGSSRWPRRATTPRAVPSGPWRVRPAHRRRVRHRVPGHVGASPTPTARRCWPSTSPRASTGSPARRAADRRTPCHGHLRRAQAGPACRATGPRTAARWWWPTSASTSPRRRAHLVEAADVAALGARPVPSSPQVAPRRVGGGRLAGHAGRGVAVRHRGDPRSARGTCAAPVPASTSPSLRARRCRPRCRRWVGGGRWPRGPGGSPRWWWAPASAGPRACGPSWSTCSPASTCRCCSTATRWPCSAGSRSPTGGPLVLTPHDGEFATLTGATTGE